MLKAPDKALDREGKTGKSYKDLHRTISDQQANSEKYLKKIFFSKYKWKQWKAKVTER